MKDSPTLSSLMMIEYRKLSRFYVPAMAGGILLALNGYTISFLFMALLLLALVLIGLYKPVYFIRPILWLIAFFILGIAITDIRIQTVKSPILDRPLYEVDIQGKIVDVSALPDRQTVIVDNVSLLNSQSVPTPKQLKLTYPKAIPILSVGDIIRIKANIRPPQKPIFPGAHNEERQLYFKGVGGTGIIYQIISQKSTKPSVVSYIENIRSHISDRIHTLFPNEVAQIAIPLTIGDQHIVSQHLYDIFRSAGITHILSVSGFHLSLLAAFVFFFIRKLLSLWPTFAERFSTKKLAAFIALIFTGGYIAISGMQAPALRSFIMISIVLLATLFDRKALSVRSWNIAAFLLLLYRPEIILNIGFQLSFLAVLILITLYPMLHDKIYARKDHSFLYRLCNLILCFALIDLLITLATTPYTLYYFNRCTVYSVLGNVLTGTLFSFWIMPLLFIGIIFMPIGWDALFFKGAAVGLEYIIAICEKIHALPYATVFCPTFNTQALIIITLGLLLLCLMTTRLRLISLPIIALGILVAVYTPRPDILVGDRGLTIAVREDNRLRFISKAPSDFTAHMWLLYNGEDPQNPTVTEKPAFILIQGKKIAFNRETCIDADLCLLPETAPRQPNAIPLYDKNVRLFYIRGNQIQIKIP